MQNLLVIIFTNFDGSDFFTMKSFLATFALTVSTFAALACAESYVGRMPVQQVVMGSTQSDCSSLAVNARHFTAAHARFLLWQPGGDGDLHRGVSDRSFAKARGHLSWSSLRRLNTFVVHAADRLGLIER